MRNIITKRSRREKTIAVLCLLAFFLTGCDGWNDREGCDGYPFVADDVLPDTVTLQVNGPPFRFDLEEAPVFNHTAGKILSYRAAASDQDRQIANPFIGGTKATLEIFPVGAGSARIEVVAEDECEKWDTLGVFVQVNDSSASPSASVRPPTPPTPAISRPLSMRDESLEDTDNLPDPDVLAAEIVENLGSALEQFSAIQEVLESSQTG